MKLAGAPSSGLLRVLGRHSRRKQRSKRYRITRARGRDQSSRRGITPRRVHNNIRSDVLSYGFEEAAIAVAKIGGATALRAPGGDFARSLVGFFGERVTVWNAVLHGGFQARLFVLPEPTPCAPSGCLRSDRRLSRRRVNYPHQGQSKARYQNIVFGRQTHGRPSMSDVDSFRLDEVRHFGISNT